MLTEDIMRRCLQLAASAGGHTAPNPKVGSVLVYQDRIIGEGWHRQYGEAHAEVNCIDAVTDKSLLAQSTLYVNLEPCAHYGKTPPCALRIVQEGIPKVVIANMDPFDKVDGNGVAILKQNGIEVETGICEKEGRWLNRRFFIFHEQKRPYIILKWASTADGFIAPPDRQRYAITNSFTQQLVHRWRTEETAIMVGYRTAIHDNPQLTSRLWQGPQPLRIVTDRNLQLPESYHLLDDSAPTWVLNELKDETRGSIRYIRTSFDKKMLPTLMEELHAQGKLSLIVEGGAHLLQNFIDMGLWDEARVFTAGHTLKNGIAAPVLRGAVAVDQHQIHTDRLQIFLREDNGFVYSVGVGL